MSETRICWWAKGSTRRSDIPLSPLALMAAAPSAKAFFTNATTSALVLKSERLGSSSLGIGLPMAGWVEKKLALAAGRRWLAKLRWGGGGLEAYFFSWKSLGVVVSVRPMWVQESRGT